MDGTINRRSFLKMMGWGGAGAALTGCDLPSTVTLEEGKEDVVSYLMPEEYVIPGIGVWYASTCAQCPANCGIHGRVREGHVLKLEGNPQSTVNQGKICMMGQAGVQGHYNPDRINSPMMREGGSLVAVSWDKAMAAIETKLSSSPGDRIAWFTGTVSGHQAALINNHLEAVGSSKHYIHEVVNNAVGQAVNADVLGEPMPRLRIDKAKMILSFGADFLGTWLSPVHFAGEYAKFRTNKSRGLLVQVEPKMSLTGGNADLWIAAKPNSEGSIALAIANELVNTHGKDTAKLPAGVKDLIAKYDVKTVAQTSGVSAVRIKKIAALLNQRAPSLVLAGATVEGQANGYAAVSAIMLLNVLLGNVGQTIESSGSFPFGQLQAKTGGSADLLAFAEAAKAKQLDVVFFSGTNPVFSAPNAIDIEGAMKAVALKVAISQFPDETTQQADIVLPLASYLEDWGTHVAAYRPGQNVLSLQQPLMEKLNAATKGMGDILLGLMKLAKKKGFEQYQDYYAYLRHAHAAMPASLKSGASDAAAWNAALQKGAILAATNTNTLKASVKEFAAPESPQAEGLSLIPSPRLGLWDGRHANLPWLQEAPDQISKLVWDSWAEIHPDTAAKLDIENGSIIKVTSGQGDLKLKAVLIKGIHPDAIGIPIGQGHTDFGRYASNIGVNPLKILDLVKEAKTGELAMYATSVKVTKTNDTEVIVKLGASDTQRGRKFVVTVPVDQVRRTEGA